MNNSNTMYIFSFHKTHQDKDCFHMWPRVVWNNDLWILQVMVDGLETTIIKKPWSRVEV